MKENIAKESEIVYEYLCPYCRKKVIRHRETKRIICDHCGRVFWGW